MNKYAKFTLYSLIIILGYTNLHLAYNNATTGQLQANPMRINGDVMLGDSGIMTPVFFIRSGNSVRLTNASWDFAVGGATSASAEFSVDPGNNTITINSILYTFPTNDGDASQFLQTNGSGTLIWAASSGGGGGGSPDLRLGFTGAFTNVGSISFNDAHFDLPLNVSNQASLSLDWGTGGPASLSQAETVNSVWTFSAGASATTNFEAVGYASASLYQGLAFGATAIDCNDAADQLLWSGGVFTCEALADADIPDTITITNLSGTNTGDVTLAGTPDYITISGQVITRAKLDISDDTNATGGAGVDITANDFTFDSTEVEATTWGAGGNATNVWTANLSSGDPTLNWTGSGATLSLGFEALGYASASKFFTVDLGASALTKQQFGIDEGGFGQFVYRASGSEHVLTDEKKISMSIASTSFNTFSSRDLMYLFRGITIKHITCIVSSATSVVINFEDGSNNNLDSITCATTETIDDGSISNATLTKGERLILERGTVTGEADFLRITVTYTEARE